MVAGDVVDLGQPRRQGREGRKGRERPRAPPEATEGPGARAAARGLVGDIYVGRVIRVLPGMQSAFVDVGGGRAAFLHVADIWGRRGNGEASNPIEKLISVSGTSRRNESCATRRRNRTTTRRIRRRSAS